jgi:hypothetical protein
MEFKKRDLLVEDKSEEGIVKKVLSKLKNVRDRAQSEIKETRALVRVLTHAVKSYAKNREFDLNDEDRRFIKGQSVDVVRGLILTIITLIPIPIPITPFLIIFGKKIGIDIVPKEQVIPEKGKSKKDKIDENKFIKFVTILNEQIEYEEKNNLIYTLCDQAIKRKLKASPFCQLKDYYVSKPEIQEKLLNAIETIYDFLIIEKGTVNQGIFPKIVKSALLSNDPTQTLYIISFFIETEKQKIEDDKVVPTTKKEIVTKQLYDKLKRYKGKKFAPQHIDEFLRQITTIGFSEYEESLTKHELKQYKTSLFLDFKCADDINQTLLKLLSVIKKEKPENKYDKFNEIFFKVTACLESFMNSSESAIKADAVYELDNPLMYEDTPVIKKGDYIEIKKMDPEVDSYLSEFFSVFKQSKNKPKKKGFLILYNFFIDMLFEWILKNGEVYRQKVIDGMSGIIYDNNMFVPKDQIEVYWSNMGQRGCDERRLSLRFRLKPGLKTMVGYIYEPGKGENSITRTEVRDLPTQFKERFVCRGVHFDLLSIDKDYGSQEDYEKQNMSENKKINIVVTESQYKTLKEMTEESLRNFLYRLWDTQKKRGEEPSLDDIIYQVTEIDKNTREDYQTIRPLWYRYNGGFSKLFKKLKDDILNKTFDLVVPEIGLNTKVKVVELDTTFGAIHYIKEVVDIFCDVDNQGVIDFYMLDDETDEERMVNDTIDAAYIEALSAYETGDLTTAINYHVYELLYKKLEKYGIPIDTEIELVDFGDSQNNISENYTKEDGVAKKILFKIWQNELDSNGKVDFDPKVVDYINYHPKGGLEVHELYRDFLGGWDKMIEKSYELMDRTFDTNDYDFSGGYDFRFKPQLNTSYEEDNSFFVDCPIESDGKVTLITDGETYTLSKVEENEDLWWEVEREIRELIEDILHEEVTKNTGIMVDVNLCWIEE